MEEVLGKFLSLCYMNKAICVMNRRDSDRKSLKIRECLERAVSLNELNFWAYFNLSSYYYAEQYLSQTINNLKCSLSCLYLLRASISQKDENSRSFTDI